MCYLCQQGIHLLKTHRCQALYFSLEYNTAEIEPTATQTERTLRVECGFQEPSAKWHASRKRIASSYQSTQRGQQKPPEKVSLTYAKKVTGITWTSNWETVILEREWKIPEMLKRHSLLIICISSISGAVAEHIWLPIAPFIIVIICIFIAFVHIWFSRVCKSLFSH